MSDNEEKDYSLIVNIAFITGFVVLATSLVYLSGPNSVIHIGQTVQKGYSTQTSYNTSANKDKEWSKGIASKKQDKNEKKALPPLIKYKFKYTYNIKPQGSVKNFVLTLPIPSDEPDTQYISDFKMSEKPSKMYNDGASILAEFSFDNLSTPKTISIQGIANLRTYNLRTAQKMNRNIHQEKDLNRYLKDEQYIESNDPYIKTIAAKIKGSTKEETLQKTYEYLQNNINYTKVNKNIGAKKALQTKQGKCSEYAAAMAALCQANGIPARLLIGNIAREKDTDHNWVEVYLDRYGWVTFDPTIKATVINVYNAGKLVKQEKLYETSIDSMHYITSGRNMIEPYKASYSNDNKNSGFAQITSQIDIKRLVR